MEGIGNEYLPCFALKMPDNPLSAGCFSQVPHSHSKHHEHRLHPKPIPPLRQSPRAGRRVAGHPKRRGGRADWAGRRGQIHVALADGGRAHYPNGQRVRTGRRYGAKARPARTVAPHCLYAAGLGQKPVSHADRAGKHRLSGFPPPNAKRALHGCWKPRGSPLSQTAPQENFRAA